MAIYAGPMIVVRTPQGMLHVHPHEIVVATGAAEIHPVCPGNRLAGIVTARAAERLHDAGVDLGRVVAVGSPPPGTWATPVPGRLVRFEGDADGPDGAPGRVRAVVTADPATGAETTTPADTVVVGLGLAPRDLLARMAGAVPVTVVGEAADDRPLPPPPTEGVVCGCMGTTVADLGDAWDHGFTELELLKRSSQACLGTCQGGACLPNVRSWIAARTSVVPDPFTARPASRQITLAEAAADTYVDAFRRTPLHDEHLAAGARMDRFGGWWRPWHYGDAVSEYWAVREGVSIGDVSTLGKLVVSGPDVVELLERLYPCHVADIKPGRSRYALLLNERGHVMDDGMILRDSETRFVLSFTSGGAANAEMWVRDWIDVWGLDVHVLDRTMSLAAINVTGPLAGHAAAPRRSRGPAALPRPRPRRDRRRAVPRHAPVVHGRGRLRAPSPGRPVGRAVAGAPRARRGPRHPAARPPGTVRAAAREGPRHRRDGHRARHDAAPARDGLGGPDGEAAVHRPGVARADGEARRPPPLARVHDGRPGPDRGLADLVRRRGRRQRDGELALPVAREGADARLAAPDAVPDRRSRSTAARPS